MTLRQTAASEAALIPQFLGKQRCNITFVVESSESMKAVLGSVKRLLIQTLLTKASLRDSLFNIITFSSKVRREWPFITAPTSQIISQALRGEVVMIFGANVEVFPQHRTFFSPESSVSWSDFLCLPCSCLAGPTTCFPVLLTQCTWLFPGFTPSAAALARISWLLWAWPSLTPPVTLSTCCAQTSLIIRRLYWQPCPPWQLGDLWTSSTCRTQVVLWRRALKATCNEWLTPQEGAVMWSQLVRMECWSRWGWGYWFASKLWTLYTHVTLVHVAELSI